MTKSFLSTVFRLPSHLLQQWLLMTALISLLISISAVAAAPVPHNDSESNSHSKALLTKASATSDEKEAQPPVKQFTVGVLANWGQQRAIERWQPMMDYLADKVPGTRFTVRPGTFEQLNQALLRGKSNLLSPTPGNICIWPIAIRSLG